MQVLITGAGGMLARDLINELQGTYEVIAKNKEELDICNTKKVHDDIHNLRPNFVINCAAYTKVDDCEKEKQKAFAVNAQGVKNLALACKKTESLLLHISSDFVFAGEGKKPYQESALTKPLSIYGQSKLAGERHIQNILRRYVIIRSSWLFGSGGNNFVSTIIKLSREREELKVVNDQTGSPTYTVDLSRAIKALLKIPSPQGTYHISNLGSCTWYQYACKILEFTGSTIKVIPIRSAQLGRPAKRPSYSVLDCTRFSTETGSTLRPWKAALKEYIQAEQYG